MTCDPHTSAGDPIKVGLLVDMPDAVWSVQELAYGFVREQYARAGRLDRPIEFVVRRATGAPSGYIKNVVDAYHDLVEQGCLVVVGPNHADNNMAIAPHADERGVPVIALRATASQLREFVFSVAWSSIPDDAALCASWLAAQGCTTVTVTYDRAAHGTEYIEHFSRLAPRAGLRVLATERLPVICDERLDAAAAETVIAHRALAPDGIVHFGTGPAAIPWALAVNESGWNPRRVMNDGFCLAAFPATRSVFEGWVGTTLWDDDNTVLTDFVDDLRESHPDVAMPPMEPLAHARDAMATTLEGVVLADILTPAGVKVGLERIRAFPAAAGGARTSISFGPYDHRGHKGADVMVLVTRAGGCPVARRGPGAACGQDQAGAPSVTSCGRRPNISPGRRTGEPLPVRRRPLRHLRGEVAMRSRRDRAFIVLRLAGRRRFPGRQNRR